ncbi:MAG: hypothetical protein FWG45_06160, partial [Oscillospiraceae bacterium]|nr:hypothetical protein [Oscillospiraceae bacterium]
MKIKQILAIIGAILVLLAGVFGLPLLVHNTKDELSPPKPPEYVGLPMVSHKLPYRFSYNDSNYSLNGVFGEGDKPATACVYVRVTHSERVPDILAQRSTVEIIDIIYNSGEY